MSKVHFKELKGIENELEWKQDESYLIDTIVEYNLQLWKVVVSGTTISEFIENEYIPIPSTEISPSTGLTLGVWEPITGGSSTIEELVSLEYRHDNIGNSEIVYLKGQFYLNTNDNFQSIIVGVLPFNARPSYIIKKTILSTYSGQRYVLTINFDGSIVISNPFGVIGNNDMQNPLDIGNTFFRPSSYQQPETEVPPLTTTTTTTLPPSINSTLSIEFVRGTPNYSFPVQAFKGTLSTPITSSLTISRLSANGFTLPDCNIAAANTTATMDSRSITWNVGESGEKSAYSDQRIDTKWFNSASYSIVSSYGFPFGIRVNGVDHTLFPGKVIQVGNDNITINYITCVNF